MMAVMAWTQGYKHFLEKTSWDDNPDSQLEDLDLKTISASCTEEIGWKQVNKSVGEQLNGDHMLMA